MLTLAEFEKYCNKGVCLRNTLKSKRCEKDYKRKECYTKYCKSIEKREPKEDPEWDKVRELVIERDKNKCRLLSVIGLEEWSQATISLCESSNNRVLDCAHVIGRGQSKKLKYYSDNIILLSRGFHSRLDQYRDPLTGKPITQAGRDRWFIRIIGRELWDRLKEMKEEV